MFLDYRTRRKIALARTAAEVAAEARAERVNRIFCELERRTRLVRAGRAGTDHAANIIALADEPMIRDEEVE